MCIYPKFSRDRLDFSSDYALDFLAFRVIKFSQSKFQAAEVIWRQFKTKIHMKSAPKLVPFSTLNHTSRIC